MALVTGDAVGADQSWITFAQEQGHKVYILLPSTRKQCKVAKFDHLINIDASDSQRITLFATLARDVIRRSAVMDPAFGYKEYMHRDIAQAQYAQSCYALAYLNLEHNAWPVKGGTAWATAAFYWLYGTERLYIYDLDTGGWVKLNNHNNQWLANPVQPPPPSGQYAGVGSRDVEPKRALDIMRQLVR